jgi:predicted permease
MVESLLQDIRHAARTLRRTPGFSAAAVIALALGIGGNAAVFSVVDGVLLHPVPFPEPDRLVALHGRTAREPKTSISYPNFLDWQRSARSFESLALWRPDFFVMTGSGPAEQLIGLMVSADFFRTLRTEPLAGRTFEPADDALGAAPVVVIGETFWRGRFAADPNVTTRTLRLDGQVHAIVGVVPRSVELMRDESTPSDVFVPVGQHGDATFRERGVTASAHAIGRLAGGVSVDQARAEMTTIARTLEQQYPDDNAGVGIVMLPLEQEVAGGLEPTLVALLAAVGFVLLIACANVANLFLARAAARSRETAVRLALGGSRARVFRQLMTEGLVLSAVGGAVGVLLAAAGTQAALGALPDALPAVANVGVNVRVLFFALVTALGTGLLVAIVPAVRATSAQVLDGLRGSRGVLTSHHRAQRLMVVAQIALTVILLLGAGLLLRSLASVWGIDPGFNPDRVLTFFTGVTGERATTPERVRASLVDISDRLVAVPGVESASVVLGAPPLRGTTTLGLWRDDQPKPKELPESLFAGVGPDYFATMGIPLRRGRLIQRSDRPGGRRVIVVDEVFAREMFPGEEAIGKHVRFDGFDGVAEIVGVVGHIAHAGIEGDASALVRAQLYLPYTQLPDNLTTIFAGTVGVVARVSTESGDIVGAIRRDLSAFSADQTLAVESWMSEILAESQARRRFALMLLGAFAAVALVLAVVGIYATVSYTVSQRTQEIGLRAALGGRPRQLLWMVIAEGGKMAVAGIAAGLAGALAMGRTIAGMLFGVSPTDGVTFMAAPLLMLLLVLAACYAPARRAATVDPMSALRTE